MILTASKYSLHFLLAYRFRATGLSLEEKVNTKCVIVQRSFLVYLMEAMMRTRFHTLRKVKSLIYRSPIMS